MIIVGCEGIRVAVGAGVKPSWNSAWEAPSLAVFSGLPASITSCEFCVSVGPKAGKFLVLTKLSASLAFRNTQDWLLTGDNSYHRCGNSHGEFHEPSKPRSFQELVYLETKPKTLKLKPLHLFSPFDY